jgi:hypothetical protein
MVNLTKGFKLFQPWASHVVQGKLNFLVRTFRTNIRGRVAVIASNNIDKMWLKNASSSDRNEIMKRIGAIGSVRIKDCIEVDIEKVKNGLVKLGGKHYLDYYPKYLIPTYTIKHNAFIWIFDEPREWKDPQPVFSKSYLWPNINLVDKEE